MCYVVCSYNSVSQGEENVIRNTVRKRTYGTVYTEKNPRVLTWTRVVLSHVVHGSSVMFLLQRECSRCRLSGLVADQKSRHIVLFVELQKLGGDS